MIYRDLRSFLDTLQRCCELRRVPFPIDPKLEMIPAMWELLHSHEGHAVDLDQGGCRGDSV